MSEPASISKGIASRYAAAVFDLAKEDAALPALEANLDTLEAALAESAELRDLINSPIYSREEQGNAIVAVAQSLGLAGFVVNTLALLASKRRLFVLPELITVLRESIMDEKGEMKAEVISAQALSAEQIAKLAAVLSAQVGKAVKLDTAVDESLIGGLVVKIGSKMIDTSVASQLRALQNTMKEVG